MCVIYRQMYVPVLCGYCDFIERRLHNPIVTLSLLAPSKDVLTVGERCRLPASARNSPTSCVLSVHDEAVLPVHGRHVSSQQLYSVSDTAAASASELSVGPFHRPKPNPTHQITDPTQPTATWTFGSITQPNPTGPNPIQRQSMRLAIYFTANKEVNKRRLSFEVNKKQPMGTEYLTQIQKM